MRFRLFLVGFALTLSGCATFSAAPATAIVEVAPAPAARTPRPSEEELLAAYWEARRHPTPYFTIGDEFAPRRRDPFPPTIVSNDLTRAEEERLNRRSREFQEAVRAAVAAGQD